MNGINREFQQERQAGALIARGGPPRRAMAGRKTFALVTLALTMSAVPAWGQENVEVTLAEEDPAIQEGVEEIVEEDPAMQESIDAILAEEDPSTLR